ncbi:MAG: SIMPL domain-containing protein [Paracoccaceae bacterium]|nr:SIMPL domain-containing protein [Paracoccaceae bacterium]
MRAFILLLVVFLPNLLHAEEPLRQIIVSATGSVSAAPDMATVRVGVTHEARTASDAMRGVSDAAAAVLADIEAAGIAARDVQTSSLTLNPVRDRRNNTERPGIRGYSASTMLTVRVRDLDSLGGLLDIVVGDGANTLNGLTFSIAEPEPLQDLARADAVRRANAKAQTLADAAGVTLGPLQSISEGGGAGAPQPMMRGAVMEAAAVPVAAGELDVQVSVTLVYAIGD